MLVKDVMKSQLSFVYEDATINEIINIMISKNIDYIPVCNKNGVLKGIITSREILMNYGSDYLASNIMVENIKWVSPKEDIHKVSLFFSKNKLSRMPVVENNFLVGVLSVSDMAKHKILLSDVANILYKKNS